MQSVPTGKPRRLSPRRRALLIVIRAGLLSLSVMLTLACLLSDSIYYLRPRACRINYPGDACEAFQSLRGNRVIVATAYNGNYRVENDELMLLNLNSLRVGRVLLDRGGKFIVLDGAQAALNHYNAHLVTTATTIKFYCFPFDGTPTPADTKPAVGPEIDIRR